MGILILAGAFGCSRGQEKSVEEITTPPGYSNSDIIRNPVSADSPTDTSQAATIVFEQDHHDFGSVSEGSVVTHTFRFTNPGNAPLLINNAQSTCGCTVPEWPKEPIPPGGSGSIRVRFETTGRPGSQSKRVSIFANTLPAETRIYLTGKVIPQSDSKK